MYLSPLVLSSVFFLSPFPPSPSSSSPSPLPSPGSPIHGQPHREPSTALQSSGDSFHRLYLGLRPRPWSLCHAGDHSIHWWGQCIVLSSDGQLYKMGLYWSSGTLSFNSFLMQTRTMVAISPHYSLFLSPSLSLPPPTSLPLSLCFLPAVPVQPAGHLGHRLCPLLPRGQNSLVLSWHRETQISTLQLVHIINKVIQNSPLCI